MTIKELTTRIAILEAALEAEKARYSARSYDYVVLHKKYKALCAGRAPSVAPDAYCITQPDGECTSEDPRCMHQAAIVLITDRAALMARCKELNAAGVNCYTQGDVLLHARTRAVIAQVVA